MCLRCVYACVGQIHLCVHLTTVSTKNATSPKSHQIKKFKFLGISRYKFEMRFWFNVNFLRGIWDSGLGGFWGCNYFCGISHILPYRLFGGCVSIVQREYVILCMIHTCTSCRYVYILFVNDMCCYYMHTYIWMRATHALLYITYTRGIHMNAIQNESAHLPTVATQYLDSIDMWWHRLVGFINCCVHFPPRKRLMFPPIQAA